MTKSEQEETIKKPQKITRKRGRSSKLTPELINLAYKYTAEGNYIKDVCPLLGICIDTYFDYLQYAERDKKLGINSLFVDFFDAIKRGEAESIQESVKNIKLAGINTWQAAAWFLERKRPENWTIKHRLEHSGSVDIRGNLEKLTDDQLEKIIRGEDAEQIFNSGASSGAANSSESEKDSK